MVVVNALSEWLEVKVAHENITYYQRYERGKAVTTLQEQPNNHNSLGTLIKFKPDRDIFSESCFNLTILKMRLQQLAYLNPDLKIILQNHTSNKQTSDRYYYPQGILEYLSEINKHRLLINNQVIMSNKPKMIF